MLATLMVMIFTSIACGIIGIFLILRKLSMITDAISHTVLLGIVLAYFLVRDLASPLLMVGATVIGVVTVYIIEALGKKILKHEDATGVVFSVLFSIAIILISRYFRGVHLDTDIVLAGEVIFAGLERVNIFGIEISKNVLQSGISMLIVLLYVKIFFKELKVSTFDTEYASLIGINVGLIFYSLMTLTSFVAVTSFESVGGILVISFFIAPAATALLISKKLENTILLTIIISIINCVIAHFISIKWNLSMSGMCATINMFSFILVLSYNILVKKKRGGKDGNKFPTRRVYNNDIQTQ